jgi:4-aminobutyrate aminotransferase-like enzyme
VLILDEIQTGFGRTGKLFAFEHRGVVPDILVLSKNVGGGIPAGVVMPREEIAEDFRTGTTPTHSGNALACRAGLAALEVLVRERLWENAARMGQRFEDGFESMRTSRHVGEARFKGLMGGVELVQDRETKEPLSREAAGRIKEALLRRFVITSASGPHGNVFRVQPPLVVTADQVDRVVSAFDEAIEEVIGG